jgi:Domain of unknown function (DUF4160)
MPGIRASEPGGSGAGSRPAAVVRFHLRPRTREARVRSRRRSQRGRSGLVGHNYPVPRLCAFYGIVIYMYRPDHPPPHFHAQYADEIAQVALDGEVLNGSPPPRALRLVREWAALHQAELAENWDLAQALEPLVPIDPLA